MQTFQNSLWTDVSKNTVWKINSEVIQPFYIRVLLRKVIVHSFPTWTYHTEHQCGKLR